MGLCDDAGTDSQKIRVSVVIPAYNAERTIDETLASVRSQSYRNIEIIVVDDGSTDGTVMCVEAHMRADSRIRLLRQQNAGVAAARNKGVKAASSEYVALTDADDLWHPEKIERQLHAIQKNPHIGLVCTLYAVIDENSFIVAKRANSLPPSYQFIDLCRRNFIGNGSSAMMRRDLVLAAGGYDSSLRERSAEGCEDLKLYLQLAECSVVEIVPLPLTGYRQLSRSLSSNGRQMLKSFDLIALDFCARRPDTIAAFTAHRIFMLRWLIVRTLTSRQWRMAASLAIEMLKGPPLLALQTALLAFLRAINLSINKLFAATKRAPRQQYSDISWD